MPPLADLVLEPGGFEEKLLKRQALPGSWDVRTGQSGVEAEAPFFERQQGEHPRAAGESLPPRLHGLALAHADRARARRPLDPQDAALAHLPQVLKQGPERMVREVPLKHLEGRGAVGEHAVEPQEQLLQIAGTGEVVVRARLQGRHAIGRGAAVRDHEDWDGPGRRLSAQGFDHADPCSRRLAEHHEVHVLILGRGRRPGAIRQAPHLMPGHVQPIRQHGGEHGIALDDEDLGHVTFLPGVPRPGRLKRESGDHSMRRREIRCSSRVRSRIREQRSSVSILSGTLLHPERCSMVVCCRSTLRSGGWQEWTRN